MDFYPNNGIGVGVGPPGAEQTPDAQDAGDEESDEAMRVATDLAAQVQAVLLNPSLTAEERVSILQLLTGSNTSPNAGLGTQARERRQPAPRERVDPALDARAETQAQIQTQTQAQTQIQAQRTQAQQTQPQQRQLTLDEFNEPTVEALLDSVTPDNSLSKAFNERHSALGGFDYRRDANTGRLVNSDWERILVVAGTGEGKTRLGMQLAIETFLLNCARERAGSQEHHICIIAVPYVVIATQFFRKLSGLRWPGYRPLLAKLLVSTNTDGNSATVCWKKRSQIEYAGRELGTDAAAYLDERFKRCSDDVKASDAYKHAVDESEQRLRNMWDPRFHGAKKLNVDVIVGSYEEIAGVFPCIPATFCAHFVFDEVQEATTAESQRFHAAFCVFTRLSASCCNGLALTGCAHILRLRSEGIFSPFLIDWRVLEFAGIPKLTQAPAFNQAQRQSQSQVHQQRRGRQGDQPSLITTFQAEFFSAYEEVDANGVKRRKQRWLYSALSGRQAGTQQQYRQCVDQIAARFPMLVKAALHLTRPGGETFIVMCNNKREAVRIELCILAIAEAMARAGLTEYVKALSDEEMRAWRYEGESTIHEADEAPEAERRRRIVRDLVWDSAVVTKRVWTNTRPKGMTQDGREKAEFTFHVQMRRRPVTEPGTWEVAEATTQHMADVRILAAKCMIWHSNAGMDWEDECIAEFNRVHQCPPLIIATQKIAIGADLPNVRGVVMLNAGRTYSKQLIEQVVGRADRERHRRYIYVEQALAGGAEEDVWRSNTAIQNMLSEIQLSGEARAEIRQRIADGRIQAVLMDVVGIADTEEAPSVQQRVQTHIALARAFNIPHDTLRVECSGLGEEVRQISATKAAAAMEKFGVKAKQLKPGWFSRLYLPTHPHRAKHAAGELGEDQEVRGTVLYAALMTREALNGVRTMLGATEPRLYVLFTLGVADTRIAATPQTASATQLLKDWIPFAKPIAREKDKAGVGVAKESLSARLVLVDLSRGNGTFLGVKPGVEVELVTRDRQRAYEDGVLAAGDEPLRDVYYNELGGTAGVPSSVLKIHNAMYLPDYLDAIDTAVAITTRRLDLLWMAVFTLFAAGFIQTPGPSDGVKGYRLDETLKARRRAKEMSFLDVRVDCAELTGELMFLAPNSRDAYLESVWAEQTARELDNGRVVLKVGMMPQTQETSAQRCFDIRTEEGCSACILACDVVNALLSRRISRLAYTDSGQATPTTSYYVTQVLGLFDKLARKRKAVLRPLHGADEDSIHQSMLLFSPVVRFLLAASARISDELVKTTLNSHMMDECTMRLSMLLSACGVERFAGAEQKDGKTLRRLLFDTPAAAHPFFVPPDGQPTQRTYNEYILGRKEAAEAAKEAIRAERAGETEEAAEAAEAERPAQRSQPEEVLPLPDLAALASSQSPTAEEISETAVGTALSAMTAQITQQQQQRQFTQRATAQRLVRQEAERPVSHPVITLLKRSETPPLSCFLISTLVAAFQVARNDPEGFAIYEGPAYRHEVIEKFARGEDVHITQFDKRLRQMASYNPSVPGEVGDAQLLLSLNWIQWESAASFEVIPWGRTHEFRRFETVSGALGDSETTGFLNLRDIGEMVVRVQPSTHTVLINQSDRHWISLVRESDNTFIAIDAVSLPSVRTHRVRVVDGAIPLSQFVLYNNLQLYDPLDKTVPPGVRQLNALTVYTFGVGQGDHFAPVSIPGSSAAPPQ